MFAGNKIIVPSSRRAYSWDTETDENNDPKMVNILLSDLVAYNNGTTQSNYYFGHFLFEEIDKNQYGVLDGQERLTTIEIFVSALFSRLKQMRPLTNIEYEAFEDLVKRHSSYRFEMVECDNIFFRNYVIDQSIQNNDVIKTDSKQRIANAFDFFVRHLADKNDEYVLKMLETIQNAVCTTYIIPNDSELKNSMASLYWIERING